MFWNYELEVWINWYYSHIDTIKWRHSYIHTKWYNINFNNSGDVGSSCLFKTEDKAKKFRLRNCLLHGDKSKKINFSQSNENDPEPWKCHWYKYIALHIAIYVGIFR